MKNTKINFFTMLLIILGVSISAVLAQSNQTSKNIKFSNKIMDGEAKVSFTSG